MLHSLVALLLDMTADPAIKDRLRDLSLEASLLGSYLELRALVAQRCVPRSAHRPRRESARAGPLTLPFDFGHGALLPACLVCRSAATEAAANELLSLVAETAASAPAATERLLKAGVEALRQYHEAGDARTVAVIVQKLGDIVHPEVPEVR